MQHKGIIQTVVALGLAMCIALVALPSQARADTTTAVNTVLGAQSAIGATFTGDPANAPALTTVNNGMSGTDSSGTTLGVTLPPADNPQLTGTTEGPMVTAGSTATANAPSTPVVLPTQGGYSMSQVITSSSGPFVYTYKFNLPTGYHLVNPPDVNYANSGAMLDTTGLYAITNAPPAAVQSGKVTLDDTNTIGWILPPTAVDASGAQVKTVYTQLSGVKLQQSVWPQANAQYPIVADPSISFGWVIYVHYNHAEVGSVLLQAFFGGVLAAAAVGCAVATLGWLAYPCAAIFAFAGIYVVGLFNTAYSRGGGIVFKFTYFGTYVGYDYVGNNYS